MTDEKIIKALECLGGDRVLCRECAYGHIPYPVCKQLAAKNALDIINRQKAEIDRLREKLDYECERCACELLDQRDKQQAMIEKLKEAYAVYEETTGLKQARAEAMKEFAERLKRRMGYCDLPNGIVRSHIDNLVKEMTEDK